MKNITKITFAILSSIFIIQNSYAQHYFQKTYGLVGSNEIAYDMKATPDGGLIVFGETDGAGAGGKDLFLMKLDSNYTQSWVKTYGGAKDDANPSNGRRTVEVCSDGGFAFIANTKSYGAIDTNDIYIVRTDANGDTLFTKVIQSTSICYSYTGRRIKQKQDKGFIVLGYGCGAENMILIALDSNGVIQWQKGYFNTLTAEQSDILIENNGDILIAGNNNQESAITKLDINGNLIWTKAFPVEVSRNIIKANNGYLITSDYGSKSLIGKVDTNGNWLWSKTIEVNQILRINKLNNGNYVLTGRTFITPNTGKAIVITIDENGSILNSLENSEPNYVHQYASSIASNNNVLLLGDKTSISSIDYNIHLIKTDENINEVCDAVPYSVNDSVITLAMTSKTFIESVLSVNVLSGAIVGNSLFIENTLCDTTINNIQNRISNGISIYPNPTNKYIRISSDNNKSYQVKLFDFKSNEILNIISAPNEKISLSELERGIYLIKVIQNDKVLKTQKIILN